MWRDRINLLFECIHVSHGHMNDLIHRKIALQEVTHMSHGHTTAGDFTSLSVI